jgi:hypothetical protein
MGGQMETSWSSWWDTVTQKPADGDWIEWMLDVTGFMPVIICFHILVIVLFALYLWRLDRINRRQLLEE